jgi:hypothetical protein
LKNSTKTGKKLFEWLIHPIDVEDFMKWVFPVSNKRINCRWILSSATNVWNIISFIMFLLLKIQILCLIFHYFNCFSEIIGKNPRYTCPETVQITFPSCSPLLNWIKFCWKIIFNMVQM